MIAAVSISLQVNGERIEAHVLPRLNLADFLREHLKLTGTHVGCEHGACGACTVSMDGVPVRSCVVLAVMCEGRKIETIEGLAPEGKLHPVSQAFWDNDAQQCGYCTPGFVMACKGFLDRNPNPTYEQVKTGLGGNLCRCGTYVGVRKAVLQAAKEMGGRNA